MSKAGLAPNLFSIPKAPPRTPVSMSRATAFLNGEESTAEDARTALPAASATPRGPNRPVDGTDGAPALPPLRSVPESAAAAASEIAPGSGQPPITQPRIIDAMPTRSAGAGEGTEAAPATKAGMARLSVDIPCATLRALKIRAIEHGCTVRELVLSLLDREGLTR
jgi:hypothetical protein